jgi:hypothetical protein
MSAKKAKARAAILAHIGMHGRKKLPIQGLAVANIT